MSVEYLKKSKKKQILPGIVVDIFFILFFQYKFVVLAALCDHPFIHLLTFNPSWITGLAELIPMVFLQHGVASCLP